VTVAILATIGCWSVSSTANAASRAKRAATCDPGRVPARISPVPIPKSAPLWRLNSPGTLLDGEVVAYDGDIVQHIKPWTPPAPSVRTRLGGEELSVGDNGITGGLPLKSVQRATSMPEWQPEAPPEPVEEAAEALEYAISDDDLAGVHAISEVASEVDGEQARRPE
jgi:hypothetical protein